VPTLPDLPAAQIAVLFTVVQRIAAVMPDALDAHGTFVALNNVVSQSVPHLHVHVVPRRRKDGLRGFFWPRQRYLDALDATTHAARLRESLAREGL
jgi:histidine triad (HIT) family protein